MEKKQYCVLGAGGSLLDPGGMAKINNWYLSQGFTGQSAPWDYTNYGAIIDDIRSLSDVTFIALTGDSCGGNILAAIASRCGNKKITYMNVIQASIYCNRLSNGQSIPAIGGNVGRVRITYSDGETFGLGEFIPPPVQVPAKPIIRAGWHIVNGGQTEYVANFLPRPHPDDNDPLVIKRLQFDVRELLAKAA